MLRQSRPHAVRCEVMACETRLLHLVSIVTLATISIPAMAQETLHPEDVSSCRHFAQDFYDWYVPLTQKSLKYPASDLAIQRKAVVFDPALLRALRADSAAQRRFKGEIAGIDFDPFVGGQDPADHYDLRKIGLKGDRCFVEVWRNSSKDGSWKPDKPDATAELSKQTGHWQFMNFHYPDGERDDDLISALAWWREERDKHR
jgi:hypothetical protein